jgi:hypothetical protein
MREGIFRDVKQPAQPLLIYEQEALHGNDHDTRVNGVGDPISGPAAMRNEVRMFCELRRPGRILKRTILDCA